MTTPLEGTSSTVPNPAKDMTGHPSITMCVEYRITLKFLNPRIDHIGIYYLYTCNNFFLYIIGINNSN